MAVKRLSKSFLAQGGNFPEHTVEEDVTYPVPYPKILSYNGSSLNMECDLLENSTWFGAAVSHHQRQ